MVEKWGVQIPGYSGRKKRTVYVYVPDSAEEERQRYPVLYMFDGHNVFFDEDATYGKSWGMKEYLEENQVPLMVVAVDCDHRPNFGRLKEYSPYSFEDERFGPIRGRGKGFLRWMTETLKPMIDEGYPTLPGRETTWIAGSSMGGLMSLYALLAHNDVFGRAASLSPSLWTAPEQLLALARSARLRGETVLYMDYGSRELNNHQNHQAMLTQFGQLSQALWQHGVFLNARIVPNGDHCEACWEEQLPFMLETLFYERM